MKTNFYGYWHIFYFLLLPFIAQTQKEYHYLVFEEKEGKINEKPVEEVFFDQKGNFIKAFAFREKDTLPMGKSYDCLNKNCVREQLKGKKFKEKKNTISLIELDDFHHTKTETIYFFENEKLVKEVEQQAPFSENQTLYFYDSRQKIALIVESIGDNMIFETTQFEYQTDFEPNSVKNIIIEKKTSFDDGNVIERKLIYIEQDN